MTMIMMIAPLSPQHFPGTPKRGGLKKDAEGEHCEHRQGIMKQLMTLLKGGDAPKLAQLLVADPEDQTPGAHSMGGTNEFKRAF